MTGIISQPIRGERKNCYSNSNLSTPCIIVGVVIYDCGRGSVLWHGCCGCGNCGHGYVLLWVWLLWAWLRILVPAAKECGLLGGLVKGVWFSIIVGVALYSCARCQGRWTVGSSEGSRQGSDRIGRSPHGRDLRPHQRHPQYHSEVSRGQYVQQNLQTKDAHR